jgi:hypothetical protein
METRTYFYNPMNGWSVDPLPGLASADTFVLLFGASEFLVDPAPIHDILDAYPNAHVIGCSSAGEIFGSTLADHSLTVAVLRFDKTPLQLSSAEIYSASDSYQAGRKIAKDLMQEDLRAIFILAEGRHVNGSELVRGVNSVLPDDVPITGGLAGDGDRFEKTWVLHSRALHTNGIVGVGFYGPHILYRYGSVGGWDLFGLERVVTRSEGNILYELDGRPALDLYKEYLGDLADGLPATALLFPLSLRPDSRSTEDTVRTILAIDEETKSMTFAGDVPQGHLATLMKANFDRLIDGASKAAQQASRNLEVHGDLLSIAISCVGRRLVLGERTEEELEAVLDAFPENTRQVGFYSYGEFSRHQDGRCDLHNQTMTVTAISEV